MKQWIGILTVAMLLLAGCKSEKGPGESLEKYLVAMIKGDYQTFASGLFYPGFANVNADSLTTHLLEANKQHLDGRYNGLQSVEIVKVTLGEDSTTATVRVKLTFGNEQTEETEYEMILVDGRWRINLAI